jgi:uncharacterized membrane protein YjjP (DUF1212 family)
VTTDAPLAAAVADQPAASTLPPEDGPAQLQVDPLDVRSAFVLELGRALHQHGAPAHRLEMALQELSTALGLEASFFATPTALFSSFRSADASGPWTERTHLRRLNPGEVDLGTFADLDRVAQRVIAGELDAAAATRQIHELERRPSRYPGWLAVGAAALASGSAARLFGGGVQEIALAAAAGAMVALLSRVTRFWPPLGRLFELLSAILVALLAGWAASFSPLASSIVILAGLIVIVPGLTLTVGVTELAQGSLVSGTSRLAGGMLALVLLGFGAALGQQLLLALGATGLDGTPAPLPGWTLPIAAALTACAFTVLLRAAPRDVPWILGCGLLTWSTAAVCASQLGPVLAAFAGATVAGVASNAYGRLQRRPSMVTRVSSILLLVPGSLGFRGVSSLLADETLRGVDTVLDVVFIAVAIVVGLLLAGSLLPPRQRL